MKRVNVDIYDGHTLLTELDGDELVHSVNHPPQCRLVDRGGWVEADCAVSFIEDHYAGDSWSAATSPGLRVIGWRHDYYPGGPWGGAEHDVVAWCLSEVIR